jgi:hypothetical protein
MPGDRLTAGARHERRRIGRAERAVAVVDEGLDRIERLRAGVHHLDRAEREVTSVVGDGRIVGGVVADGRLSHDEMDCLAQHADGLRPALVELSLGHRHERDGKSEREQEALVDHLDELVTTLSRLVRPGRDLQVRRVPTRFGAQRPAARAQQQPPGSDVGPALCREVTTGLDDLPAIEG